MAAVLFIIVKVATRFNYVFTSEILEVQSVTLFYPEGREHFFAFWANDSLPFVILRKFISFYRILIFIIDFCDHVKHLLIIIFSLLASLY